MSRIPSLPLLYHLCLYSPNHSSFNICNDHRRFFGNNTKLPINTIINFVPQQQAWIVERFGKFHKVLKPGLNYLIPLIDEIKYVQSLKEIAIEIPSQSAITEDNVSLTIDGVLYYRVLDPFLASYGIEDGEYAVVQLGQTTMRSELGKISLDKIFQERATLNHHIVAAINQASSAWGINCLRYEIKDISVPHKVKEAMQMMVAAERSKRAKILESEGIKESEINVAKGKKQARILLSEAQKVENINSAVGTSEATILLATGQSKAIDLVSNSLKKEHGLNSASLAIAKEYIDAFAKLAKHSNTLILSSDTSNISSMVSQAMSIYNKLYSNPISQNSSQIPNPNVETTGDVKLKKIGNITRNQSENVESNNMSVFSSDASFQKDH